MRALVATPRKAYLTVADTWKHLWRTCLTEFGDRNRLMSVKRQAFQVGLQYVSLSLPCCVLDNAFDQLDDLTGLLPGRPRGMR